MMLSFYAEKQLNIKVPTHLGQSLKVDASNLMANFILFCNHAIADLNLKLKDDLNCIGNMDETPLFYEMNYNKTVAKIGSKKSKCYNFWW